MIFYFIYICILAGFTAFCVRKTKYSVSFALIFLSFALISFSAVMCIIKFSNYRSVMQSEMAIYFMLDKIRMSYYEIKDLTALGVAGYFFGLAALSMVCNPGDCRFMRQES